MSRMNAQDIEKNVIDRVIVMAGWILVAVLVLASAGAWFGSSFAKQNVHNELMAQKIFFPDAGSPGFSPDEYPTLQQYAGQQVDDGMKAKAFANEYLGHHLEKIGGGKTYSEVSTLSLQDPTNQKLIQQKNMLFQGETLRGMLLGNAYAFWTVGQMAFYASIAALALAIIFALSLLVKIRGMKKIE